MEWGILVKLGIGLCVFIEACALILGIWIAYVANQYHKGKF